ncbi:TPA: hypothetical protein ACGQ50_000823 [Enterobacter cloacae]
MPALRSDEAINAMLEKLEEYKARIQTLESEIEQHYWCGYTDGHSRGFCCGKLYGEDSQMAQHRQACYVAYREQIKGE